MKEKKNKKLYRKFFQIMWAWQNEFEMLIEGLHDKGENAWCWSLAISEKDGCKYEVVASEKAMEQVMLHSCHMLVF